jgi:hypothetical protein
MYDKILFLSEHLHMIQGLKRSVQILFNLIMLGSSVAQLGGGGAEIQEIQLAPAAGAVIIIPAPAPYVFYQRIKSVL